MKSIFSKLLVLVLLIAIFTLPNVHPTFAQSPDPPEILENGEFPSKLAEVEYAIAERLEIPMVGGDNNINAVTTWWSSSGTTFVPASSTITYNYGGEGCVDTSANSDMWRGMVNLPNGSTITSMWFNYSNEITDPVDSTIYLRRYSYSGTYNDILHVNGSAIGIGHHTTHTSTVANNIVNNFIYAYVLAWIGKVDQNLCGVNLEFEAPPIWLNALPLITR